MNSHQGCSYILHFSCARVLTDPCELAEVLLLAFLRSVQSSLLWWDLSSPR